MLHRIESMPLKSSNYFSITDVWPQVDAHLCTSSTPKNLCCPWHNGKRMNAHVLWLHSSESLSNKNMWMNPFKSSSAFQHCMFSVCLIRNLQIYSTYKNLTLKNLTTNMLLFNWVVSPLQIANPPDREKNLSCLDSPTPTSTTSNKSASETWLELEFNLDFILNVQVSSLSKCPHLT